MLNVIAGMLGSGAAAVTNSYESIATVTVGAGGSSSISFSSIPSTYKHLQIRYIAKANANDIIVFQVNGDTGNNYANHVLAGNGSAASASATTSYSYGVVSIIGGTASTFGAGVCDILDYANTSKNKTFRTLGGRENNSEGRIELRSSLWMSTSAMTSIILTTDSTTSFSQYSQFALYGIKG